MKSDIDPLHPTQRLQNTPRWTEKSKRSGKPCGSLEVRDWKVCRMHGACGGAKTGEAHPNYRHGTRSREFAKLSLMASKLIEGLMRI